MNTFLKDILHSKQYEVQEKKKKTDLNELAQKAKDLQLHKKPFSQSIKRSPHEEVNFIGEIKKASPSKGVIRDPFRPLEIAKIYQKCGVKAISVLTDEKYFQGSLDNLEKVSRATKLPTLRKDFIVDPYQIFEAKLAYASAVLLIVAALDEEKLKDFILLAKSIEMDALVEVHNLRDLEHAINAGAELIGINHRDLETFHVDLKVSDELIPHVPEEATLVVESGIHTREEVQHFNHTRTDALLIGEALMKEKDIDQQLNLLMGKRI